MNVHIQAFQGIQGRRVVLVNHLVLETLALRRFRCVPCLPSSPPGLWTLGRPTLLSEMVQESSS